MDPRGIIKDLFLPQSTFNWSRFKWSGRAREKLEKSASPLKTSLPTLYSFPAGFGDSTLFSWKNCNVLIDGGISSSKPCFWPIVRGLPKLDAVIVTHYDKDHISGIIRLVESKAMDISTLYTLTCSSDSEAGRSAKQGLRLLRSANRQKLSVVDTLADTEYTYSEDGDEVRIVMVTPQKIDANKCRAEMEKLGRDLSAPNEGSVSLYIECKSKAWGKPWMALLTGDAPSCKIVNGLKNKFKDKSPTFDYVDVPHHGSWNNEPKKLLDYLNKCKVCVVSTNGKRHCHPDKETVEELRNRLQDGRIDKVAFTYSNPQRRPDQDEIRESFRFSNIDSKRILYASNTNELTDYSNMSILKTYRTASGDTEIIETNPSKEFQDQ
eukprot:Rmarinus@m.10117